MDDNANPLALVNFDARGPIRNGLIEIRLTFAPDRDSPAEARQTTPALLLQPKEAREIARVLLELAAAIETGAPPPTRAGPTH